MKKVIIYGLGVSGQAMYELLGDECEILLYRDGEGVPEWAEGKKFLGKGESIPDDTDALLLSPSVPLNRPLVKACKEKNIPVMGELELGYIRSKCRVVAVTGTNGKTTTVSLINHILRSAGRSSYALGNIGVPFCSMCEKLGEEDIAVLEASSFQLESCTRFAPYISAILNITPDHFDRHGDFLSYAAAKKNIFAFQNEGFCVLNADDPVIRAIEWRGKAQKLFFSTERKPEGCYLDNGKIILKKGGTKDTVCDASALKIKGVHNIQNAMCALIVCRELGLDVDELRRGLLSFEGVEHRLESAGSVKGVKFVNDSKSTNVDSTIKAVNAFGEKTYLILGGRDKNLDFCELFAKMPPRVKKIALIGEAAETIASFAQRKGFKRYCFCDGLENAVRTLYAEASAGDVILLSPACASFDSYRNFAERGEHFKKIVEKLKNETY